MVVQSTLFAIIGGWYERMIVTFKETVFAIIKD